MLVFSIISFVLLAGFIILSGIMHGGIPASYSAFSADWARKTPKLNTWSVVTFMAALGMVPPMIEAGDGSMLQFLGFFAPLYLIVVSLTPDWDVDRRQRKFHMAGAITCAVLALLWLFLIRGHWFVVAGCLAAGIIAGALTKTLRCSLVFWGEMILFASVYVSLWIGG